MKSKVVRLVLVMLSFICLTACAQKDLAAEISSLEEIEEGSTLPEEAKSEKPKKIDRTKFENLHETATQVGFSVRVEDVPVEEIEATVSEFIKGELQ